MTRLGRGMVAQFYCNCHCYCCKFHPTVNILHNNDAKVEKIAKIWFRNKFRLWWFEFMEISKVSTDILAFWLKWCIQIFSLMFEIWNNSNKLQTFVFKLSCQLSLFSGNEILSIILLLHNDCILSNTNILNQRLSDDHHLKVLEILHS